jgi:hypothetical protein
MTMRFTAMASLALAFAGMIWAAPAVAQNCSEDVQKLVQRRVAEMQTINKIAQSAKAAHKQIDPVVFCAKSGGLLSADKAMGDYLEKNKDWCQIPDEFVANFKATAAQDAGTSGKACKVAAQFKKMKEQADSGGGPQAQPLPAGPL